MGSKTRFYVNADRFAILPSGTDTTDGNGANIPFIVDGGVVYIDSGPHPGWNDRITQGWQRLSSPT